MIEIISKLEPIEYEAKQTIFDELEEVNEIVFLIDVAFQVGFTINNKKYFRMEIKNKGIGVFYCTFNKKSTYVFRTKQACEVAYFVRKKNWSKIINSEDTAELCGIIKQKIKKKYVSMFETNLNILKN